MYLISSYQNPTGYSYSTAELERLLELSEQATLHEFISRGYYDAHLRRIHGVLDQRYLGCLDLLREWMPEGVRFSTPGGGPTLWLDLPASRSVEHLAERLARRGVFIEQPGAHFYGQPHLNGFRVGFAFLSPERLRLGLRAVADELAQPSEQPSAPLARAASAQLQIRN